MAGSKILVVDDEEEVLQIIAKKLVTAGYEIITATKGREAIEKARIHSPDLVLMDIMLPDIEGSEAVKLLNNDPLTQRIPILFLSGIVSKEEDAVECEVKVDGRSYNAISKPFTFQELLMEIKKILE